MTGIWHPNGGFWNLSSVSACCLVPRPASSPPSLCVWMLCRTCILTKFKNSLFYKYKGNLRIFFPLWEVDIEEKEFETSLCYIVVLKPAWVTLDPASKQRSKTQPTNQPNQEGTFRMSWEHLWAWVRNHLPSPHLCMCVGTAMPGPEGSKATVPAFSPPSQPENFFLY